MSFVYWIHLPEHTDLNKEGYVGVTSQTVSKRFKEHCRNKKSTILTKSLKKYKERIIVSTIVEGSEDYCYMVEQKLRPVQRIGWNIAQGGYRSYLKDIPKKLHPCFRRVVSPNTRSKISKAVSGSNNGMSDKIGELNHFYGKTHSEEVLEKLRNKKISQSHKELNSKRLLSLNEWESPAAAKATWIRALYYYHCFLKNESIYFISKREKIPATRLNTMFHKFKNNWNPEQDSKYLEWLKLQKEENGSSLVN